VGSVPSQESSHDAVVEATADTERTMQPQRVPINVYEATGALVVVCPMPAVKADDVTVELGHGTLRFFARLRSAPRKDYLVHEWEYGGYEREVDLPEGFGGGVEATLTNGQLAVRVLRGSADDTIKITPSGKITPTEL
jgi:HSP20 family molecular chaperone IbpA